MTTGQWDDPKYPYLPRFGTSASQPFAEPKPTVFPWKLILRWLTRAVIAAGALTLIALITLGGILFQAGSRAWSLAKLEDQGVALTYWHEPPFREDALSREWRDTLGDHWWSDVREVAYSGPTWQWFTNPRPEEIYDIVSACGQFRRLKSFQIASDHFSCDLMENWASLTQLEKLDIQSSRLSDNDLTIIGRMTSLKELHIGGASGGKVSTDGLMQLARLPQLETLILHQMEIGPGASTAGQLSALQRLTISNSSTFDDQALLSLGALPQLNYLDISSVPISERGLANVLQSSQLQSISIERANLTDAVVKEIVKNSRLSSLELMQMPLTDAGLVALEGKELASLSFAGTQITDDGLRSIAQITGLESLNLDDCKLSGSGLAHFAGPAFPAQLSLAGAPLTAEGIAVIAKMPCAGLTLARTSLTDEQLMLFVDRDDLELLDVGSTQVTAEGVKAFYEARKQRLKMTGQQESLNLISDYPEEAEPYYRPWGRSDFSIDSETFSVEP